MIHKEDLAKFGDKLNMEAIFWKHLSIFLATYLNHVCKSDDFPYILVELLLLKISKSTWL
jgi:hypothetical protein